MATTKEEIAVQYPIPNYRFTVTLGDESVPFNSVSGLEIGFETIEYKDGTGSHFKMPGQRHPVNMTLSRGIFPGKNALYDWINTIQLNQVSKKDILVSLTNDAGTEVLLSWNVTNAFPLTLSAPEFNATSNEISVQQITLMADRVTIQTV